MKALFKSCAALAASVLLATAALAADPSGTWKFNPGGDAPESTLVLAVNDGHLGGSIITPGRNGKDSSIKIASASVKGEVVNLTVHRTVKKEKVVTKYSGRLEGDTITGKIETTGGPEGMAGTHDWVARRSH
jgi:hypothetical protein